MSSPTRPFCADTSRADAEPLAATASRVETWLLIEYRGLWSRDAVDGSTLSAEVKDHLRQQRAVFPHTRILFIRRTERRREDGLKVFVARTAESTHDLRCLELERYDDLLDLELATEGVRIEHPLFLVCTHGKHDRCCSKFGRPLYDAVREQVEEGWAWQSSHVGGDRFAGNIVSLPDGVYYGRVEPGESWPVLEAALRGEIHLPHYRGRSCHSFPAQAAERAVRERAGLVGVDETSVLSLEPVGAGWEAVVRAGGSDYAVQVRREEGSPTHLTCSTEELRRPKRYLGELRGGGTPPARVS